MTLQYQIEYTTPNGEVDVLDVDLLGDPVVDDNEYDDEYGTVKVPASLVLEEIRWDKDDFSDEENTIIETYVTGHYEEFEKLFIKKYNDTHD